MNLTYPDLTKAWEGINELFLEMPPQAIDDYNGFRVKNGGWYLYHLSFMVTNPVFDPEFDFGRHFNYTETKWRSLLGNYLHIEELDEYRRMISDTHYAKPSPYALSYIFTNTHKNGKGCLMQMVASRRVGSVQAYLTFYLRASEVTKRLAVDLLLAQRICEYIYKDTDIKPYVVFEIVQAYADDTIILMYNAHKSIKAFFKHKNTPRKKELLERLDTLMKTPAGTIRYKVHERAYIVIRSDLFSQFYPKTLAKDCTLDKAPKTPPSKVETPLEEGSLTAFENLKKNVPQVNNLQGLFPTIKIPIPMVQNPQIAAPTDSKTYRKDPRPKAQAQMAAEEQPAPPVVKRGPGRPPKDPNAPPKPKATTTRQTSARIQDVRPDFVPYTTKQSEMQQQPVQTYPGMVGGPAMPGQPMMQPQSVMAPQPMMSQQPMAIPQQLMFFEVTPSMTKPGGYDLKITQGMGYTVLAMSQEELYNLSLYLNQLFGR